MFGKKHIWPLFGGMKKIDGQPKNVFLTHCGVQRFWVIFAIKNCRRAINMYTYIKRIIYMACYIYTHTHYISLYVLKPRLEWLCAADGGDRHPPPCWEVWAAPAFRSLTEKERERERDKPLVEREREEEEYV